MTPMQQSFEVMENLRKVDFITGSAEMVFEMQNTGARPLFAKEIVDFLNDVSRIIMNDPRSKGYSDVITFAFWIRKGSVLKLKERFCINDGAHLGKGIVFHIAPSNVPVNFAYSLVSGLLCGNANIVRIPSKDFVQVEIITDAINESLRIWENIIPYILCVRYGRDKCINDLFSSIADMRIVWGGDQTIAEIRKSPLAPRAGEITFADRYSLAVIDSDAYMDIDDKFKVAENFYNDTFFFDQNACTSPRIIVWTGGKITAAKQVFWELEHELVKKKYIFQPIQGVNKLTQSFLIASIEEGVKVGDHTDNLIIRVRVPELTDYLMEYRGNSGFFYEYDCRDIVELLPLVNDTRCQTIAYVGDKKMFKPLITSGVKGIDRIVPMGKTMDFDLIWDGYNLPSLLSRTVVVY